MARADVSCVRLAWQGCDLCALGTQAGGNKSAECDPCIKGKYAPSLGQQRCTNCPAGKWQNLVQQYVCNDNPPGKFSLEGSESPELVRLGRRGAFLRDATDGALTIVVVQCGPHRAAPYAGMSACVACDRENDPLFRIVSCQRACLWFVSADNSDSDLDHTRCICAKGYFAETTGTSLQQHAFRSVSLIPRSAIRR